VGLSALTEANTDDVGADWICNGANAKAEIGEATLLVVVVALAFVKAAVPKSVSAFAGAHVEKEVVHTSGDSTIHSAELCGGAGVNAGAVSL
jgi:hypothetical protein